MICSLLCSDCDADTLADAYVNEAELAAKLLELFETCVDCMPCEEYRAIKDKYCPPCLRQWEPWQFEEGSPEYEAFARRLKELEKNFE